MDIDVRIREKLNKYNLGDLKDFDDKTIKRLYEIENFLYNMEVNAKKLEEELKGLKLARVLIMNGCWTLSNAFSDLLR